VRLYWIQNYTYYNMNKNKAPSGAFLLKKLDKLKTMKTKMSTNHRMWTL
jgi:hypothetical protein